MDASSILRERTAVLRLIADGVELERVLAELAAGLERVASQWRVSVQLLDHESMTLRLVAAPSLSAPLRSALDGLIIGPGVNTAGSAAWSGELEISEDVDADPRWESVRPLTGEHGIRSAWSWPIASADDGVLGTLTAYATAPGRPDDAQVALLRDSACIAAIAIGRRLTIRRLTADARRDSLTGLPNRRAIYAELEDALRRAGDRRVGVLFLDLDGLKPLNDSLGHDRADTVLREVGGRLCAAGGPHLVGRLAGDEFVVVCRDADVASATAIAERILEAMREPLVDAQVVASVSIGIALVGISVGAAQALHRADAAMYEAKRIGGDGWVIADGPTRNRSARRAALSRRIPGAEHRGELQLRYEPFVNLANGAIGGLRAHPVWRSPELGEVAADEIFTASRDAGGSVALGAWILRESCQAVSRISRQTGRSLDLIFSVAPQQLAYDGFAHTVAQVLGHTGVEPRRVWLQLGAAGFTDRDPRIAAARADLRRMGVKLALAHADQASVPLAALVGLDVNGMSLNSETVLGLPDDAAAAAVAEGLATVAAASGIALCAGGVSTERQRDAVHALGFARGHGPIFGDPQDEAAILAQLSEPRADTRALAG